MNIHRYSPKEQTHYVRLATPKPYHEEDWNLQWLTLGFGTPTPFAGHEDDDIMVHTWRSVSCLTETGEWHNPHSPPAGRVVAELLRGSPYAFFEWATTSKIARKLPIAKDYNAWIKTMERRLQVCVPHPDDVYYTTKADAGVFAKFM